MPFYNLKFEGRRFTAKLINLFNPQRLCKFAGYILTKQQAAYGQ